MVLRLIVLHDFYTCFFPIIKEKLINENKKQIKKMEDKKGNITQEILAKKLDVSRQIINSIEKGKYLPLLQLAFKISNFFSVSIEEIFFIEY